MLKVGQSWKTRGGRIVHVGLKSSQRSWWVADEDGAGYLVDTSGKYGVIPGSEALRDAQRDLIERVTRVYIAGPMTDIPEYNFPAFHAAAAEYRKRGCFVLNPAEINPETPDATNWTPEQKHEFWCECMRNDIPLLLTCEMIVLLPGWKNSKGATLEHHTAVQMGMAIVYPEDWYLHDGWELNPADGKPWMSKALFDSEKKRLADAGFADLAPCCRRETRTMGGGCSFCGDPCY